MTAAQVELLILRHLGQQRIVHHVPIERGIPGALELSSVNGGGFEGESVAAIPLLDRVQFQAIGRARDEL